MGATIGLSIEVEAGLGVCPDDSEIGAVLEVQSIGIWPPFGTWQLSPRDTLPIAAQPLRPRTSGVAGQAFGCWAKLYADQSRLRRRNRGWRPRGRQPCRL